MQRFRFEDAGRSSAHYVRPSVTVLGAEFGRDEVRHIVGACLALALIFAAAFAGGARSMAAGLFAAAFVLYLPLSALAVVPSFFAAQLAQKRVARAFGCTTEFRLQGQFLLISVLFAFLFSFVLAMPGFTQRFGPLTREGAARMSAAVPLAFIAVAGAAVLAMASFRPPAHSYLWFALQTVGSANAFLAAFSLFPMPGLPGADIWRASRVLFASLVGATVGVFVAVAVLSGA